MQFGNIKISIGMFLCLTNSVIGFPTGENICKNCVCGARGRSTRIVGGSEAIAHEFPWLGGLIREGKLYCGAALITDKHLITAAHCLEGFDLRDIKVLLGAHNLTTRDGIKIGIKHAWVHKDFDIFTFNNDIAILELKKSVEFGPTVQTVCLPQSRYEHYSGTFGIVAGWGRTEEKKPSTNILRTVTIPVWSEDQCKEAGYGQKKITENMMCAGYHDGKKDACQGDSGGPMHLSGATGSMEIIGVVSWGRGCARPNLPGIYTKVENYLSWIHDIIQFDCTCPAKSGIDKKRTYNDIQRGQSKLRK